MPRSWLNPKQSDYAGQLRFGVIAIVFGITLLIIGVNLNSEIWKTLLASGGVGILIGGGAVINSALHSRSRAKKMKNEK
ncbi:MAG: hypothetical protein KKD01_00150 [Proteobacteria bacterium]|nr:hypothetical protein [Pseudomonadota bacterium]MBU1417546.1 hypothetical protein [Pseudomonadota bacterium]MBU1453107.1 hypothetical protein [Pseudomonadota bacterium]